MEFKNTLEIVTKDIQDIEKLVSNFKNYSVIPNIELELVLSKLRNVYDVLLMFRESSGVSISVNEIPGSSTVTESATLSSSVPEQEKIPDIIPDEEAKEVSVSITSKWKDEQSAEVTDTNEITIKEKKSIEYKKTVRKEERIIGNTFIPDQSFINESLGEKHRKADVSSILQSSPIKTISGSMGINDKFFFIRELFNGDSELFTQTLYELDKSLDFDSSCTFLMNKFSWDMESEPARKFLNLLRRKFVNQGNE